MSTLVLIRHGQSKWNLENRFTGWVDVPLSVKGIQEAISAGKKLKNYKFDTIFVSHMLRAIQTLHYILIESKNTKTPIFKHENKRIRQWEQNYTNDIINEIPIFQSVELAERYYGDLQGLNKQKTREKYGAEQVHLWRRSYNINPPHGESLKDTCERTIPYYKKYIEPEVKNGKTVLVSAHGNSLRSITMHIEKISEQDIPGIEIPTGIPIVYTFTKNLKNFQKKLL